jgi:cytidine deaminase
VSAGIDWEALFRAAEEAQSRAHAPYSQFQVGAAALLDDGSIVQGCNVENASFGLSVCAERHAVAAAVLRGKPHLVALALVGSSKEPVTPCGACRQVLSELNGPSLPIRSRADAKEGQFTLGQLLPVAFGPERLRDR